MMSGIYAICNIRTKKYYVGQASILHRRFKDHKALLRSNRHHNKYLQASWNKHGEEIFKFKVLEYCPIVDLTVREIEWVETLRSSGLYNIATVEAPMLGRKHTVEAINKMKKPRSKETAKKISMALTGKKHSEEHCRKTGLSKRKAVYEVATGKQFDSIKEAAKYIGVHPYNLGKHLNGVYKLCKGKEFKYRQEIE